MEDTKDEWLDYPEHNPNVFDANVIMIQLDGFSMVNPGAISYEKIEQLLDRLMKRQNNDHFYKWYEKFVANLGTTDTNVQYLDLRDSMYFDQPLDEILIKLKEHLFGKISYEPQEIT